MCRLTCLLSLTLFSVGCPVPDGEPHIPQPYTPSLGSGAACIDGDLSFFDPVLPPTSPITLDISGTVVSDGPSGALNSPFECWGTVYRALEVLDSDGVTWKIGYGLEDADGENVTPAMDLTPGDTVSVRYQAVQEFGRRKKAYDNNSEHIRGDTK